MTSRPQEIKTKAEIPVVPYPCCISENTGLKVISFLETFSSNGVFLLLWPFSKPYALLAVFFEDDFIYAHGFNCYLYTKSLQIDINGPGLSFQL